MAPVRGFRLGIDYGTSNTVAVLAWPDGRARPLLFDASPTLPSAVAVAEDGGLRTGREAQRSARIAPERYEPNPKRRIDDLELLLGDRSYPLADVVAATLRRVGAEAARTAGGPIGEVTITHPVEWGPARRSLLIDAAARAGLPQPTLVAEPVAAATYFADVLDHRVPAGRSVVVYDLGGGTFDACVVRRTPAGFEPLSYLGIDDFGGVDLDALVVSLVGQVAGRVSEQDWQHLLRPADPGQLRHSRVLWEDARLAKESLSRQNTAGIFVPLIERDVHVTRDQFEAGAREALTRTAEVTMSAIRQARVTPADVAGIFLVGGSTRVPMVATLLHQHTGIAPTALEQPEIVVAEGALHHGTASGATLNTPAGPPPVGAFRQAPPPGGAAPVSGPPPGQVAPPASGPPASGRPVSGQPVSAGPSFPGGPPAAHRAGSAVPGQPGAYRQQNTSAGGRHRALLVTACVVVFALLVAGGIAGYELLHDNGSGAQAAGHESPQAAVHESAQATDDASGAKGSGKLPKNMCSYVDFDVVYEKADLSKPRKNPKHTAAPNTSGCSEPYTNEYGRNDDIDVYSLDAFVQGGIAATSTYGSDWAKSKYDEYAKTMAPDVAKPKKPDIGKKAVVGPFQGDDQMSGIKMIVLLSHNRILTFTALAQPHNGSIAAPIPDRYIELIDKAMISMAKKTVGALNAG